MGFTLQPGQATPPLVPPSAPATTPGAPGTPRNAGLEADRLDVSSAARPGPDARLDRMQADLARVVAEAKYGHATRPMKASHLAMLKAIYSPGWIFNTAIDQPPREMHGRADELTRKPDGLAPAGSTPESRLTQAILAAPGPLEPAAVLSLALAATGNDYFLASLTAHNLLKNATCTERRLAAGRAEDPAVVDRDRAVIARLAPLRAADSDFATDKMGPWYHTFGLATLDAANHWMLGSHAHGLDELALQVEHQSFLKPSAWHGLSHWIEVIGLHSAPARKLAGWLERRHPLNGADSEKARIDQMAVNAFAAADRSHERATG